MKKIERRYYTGLLKCEVVVKKEALDELEQQRDEAIEALINLTKEKYQSVYRQTMAEGDNYPLLTAIKAVKPYIDIIEKFTSRPWEESKAGKG